MSRELGSKLPSQVAEEASKDHPRLNAIPLVSIDRQGFPHVALISYYELLFHHQSLVFFLSSFSRSAKFLRERNLCTLVFVHRDFVYYIKARARWLGDCESVSIFQLAVESVWEDFPSPEEGETLLETGIRLVSGSRDLERRVQLREKVRLRLAAAS